MYLLSCHDPYTTQYELLVGQQCSVIPVAFFFYSCIATNQSAVSNEDGTTLVSSNYIQGVQVLKQLFFLVRHRHTSRVRILR